MGHALPFFSALVVSMCTYIYICAALISSGCEHYCDFNLMFTDNDAVHLYVFIIS